MSFTFDLIINPIVLSLAVLGGALVGFVFAKGKLVKAHSQIMRLESELLTSNQETLEAQKAFVALEAHFKDHAAHDEAIPVIPMKISGGKDNNSKEKATK